MDDQSRKLQLDFNNAVLSELDDWVTEGGVEDAAGLIEGFSLATTRLSMFQHVWLICIFGKLYLQIGQWEKALADFNLAKAVWEGAHGWRSITWTGNEEARNQHSLMIEMGLELCHDRE